METPVPTTLDEVESLIKKLYSPGNTPSELAGIQNALQRLQKSAEGWQLAQELLSRPDDNVRFFGALTIIVKLNTDVLEEGDAQSLLPTLVNWLLKALADGSGPIVTRKLCSALATYFIHYSQLWVNCMHHLLYCLSLNQGVPVDSLGDSPKVEDLCRQISGPKLSVAIYFAMCLVEEVDKTDTKSTKFIGLHERLLENAPVITAALVRSLDTSDTALDVQSRASAIKCLQGWITYAQRVSKEPLTTSLRALIQPVVQCVFVPELYEPSMELLADALSNWQAFFTPAHCDSLYSLLESPWAAQKYQNLIQGDFDFDSLQFGQLMIAFGDAQMSELMEGESKRSQALLSGLVGLLAAEGFAVAEDKIFYPALEFWLTFVESLVDEWCTEEKPAFETGRSFSMQAISHCWRKIQYPDISVYSAWDSAERVEFSEMRRDVADILQSVHTMAGASLVSRFVDLILEAQTSTSWAEIEASAFCLGALSDLLQNGSESDEMLTRVFGSPLFDTLRQGNAAVPVKARQTCLSLIEKFSAYFSRHAEFLPAALTLLFSAAGETPLAGSSSKSILSLCSTCRSLLTPEAGNFIGYYSTLRSSATLDTSAEEKIVGAVASIIQAIKDDSQRFEAFRSLLVMIVEDVSTALQLSRSGTQIMASSDPILQRAYDYTANEGVPANNVAEALAVRALRCFTSIAKGLQSPYEVPVDLDAEGQSATALANSLEPVHTEILGLLSQIRTTFPENGEILEWICHIFRAGFSETEPGPFVFPPEMITEFLLQSDPKHRRIGVLVNTACVFIRSLGTAHKRLVIPHVSQLLPWSIHLLQGLSADDPELAQHGVEFAERVMGRCPETFISLQPSSLLEFLFMFTIKLLNGNEPLPKYAAAEFFSSFIALSTGDANTDSALENAMRHLGPLIVQSLVQNIGGNASRSDLDKLCDPFKKLIVRQAHVRQWLEAALRDPSFPSDKVSNEDKDLFVKKVISLRGTRPTNQVVREFWLACRGSNFAYVS